MLKNISKVVLHLGWDGKTINLAPGETVKMESFGTKTEGEEGLLENRFLNIEGPNLERVAAEKEVAPEENKKAGEEGKD